METDLKKTDKLKELLNNPKKQIFSKDELSKLKILSETDREKFILSVFPINKMRSFSIINLASIIGEIGTKSIFDTYWNVASKSENSYKLEEEIEYKLYLSVLEFADSHQLREIWNVFWSKTKKGEKQLRSRLWEGFLTHPNTTEKIQSKIIGISEYRELLIKEGTITSEKIVKNIIKKSKKNRTHIWTVTNLIRNESIKKNPQILKNALNIEDNIIKITSSETISEEEYRITNRFMSRYFRLCSAEYLYLWYQHTKNDKFLPPEIQELFLF